MDLISHISKNSDLIYLGAIVVGSYSIYRHYKTEVCSHVADGDSANFINHRGEEDKVRLYGIDAPESKQEFGAESTEYLKSIILNKRCYIKRLNKDRYGRSVALVYRSPFGKSVNYKMVQNGYAWWEPRYAKDEILYKKAQIRAQYGLWKTGFFRRGIWKNNLQAIEPWVFRDKKK